MKKKKNVAHKQKTKLPPVSDCEEKIFIIDAIKNTAGVLSTPKIFTLRRIIFLMNAHVLRAIWSECDIITPQYFRMNETSQKNFM